jgi:RNA polymerase sigma-70 factor (sigma-E family)
VGNGSGGGVDDAKRTFEEFVLARQAALYRSAFLLTGDRHLAEDLVQSSLERAYQYWRRISSVDNPDAYLRRIMVNLATDWWRSKRRAIEKSLAEVRDIPSGETGQAEHAEHRDLVVRALSTLPPGMRAVVVLRYYEDRSEAETAEIMGCSVGNVKSQAARALSRMRAVIEPERMLQS